MSRLSKSIWETALRLEKLGVMDKKVMQELRTLYDKDVQDEESLATEEEIFGKI